MLKKCDKKKSLQKGEERQKDKSEIFKKMAKFMGFITRAANILLACYIYKENS